MGPTDAHLHLPQAADGEEVVVRSRLQGIRLFSVSTDEADSLLNYKLKEAFPETITWFAGLHPSEVGRKPLSEKILELMNIAEGVGEIGLDPKYSEMGIQSAQYRTLIKQLELAERKGKPVQVHSRNAERETLEALEGFSLKSVLLHWFEGEELLEEASSKGYFISFGPALLYSKKLRRMAGKYPQELVLTESDDPVVYGVLGESAHGPSLIPSVIFSLAEIWGSDYAETQLKTSDNAHRYVTLR